MACTTLVIWGRVLLQVLKLFGSNSPLDLGADRSSLTAAAELECALVEHVYNSPQTALGHLQAASLALGMQTTVEGELRLSHLVSTLPQPLTLLLLLLLLPLLLLLLLFAYSASPASLPFPLHLSIAVLKHGLQVVM